MRFNGIVTIWNKKNTTFYLDEKWIMMSNLVILLGRKIMQGNEMC